MELTDEVIEMLKNKKVNNRFLCELFTHEDFPKPLIAIEVYLDKGLSDSTRQMNTMFDFIHKNLRGNINMKQGDEVFKFIK